MSLKSKSTSFSHIDDFLKRKEKSLSVAGSQFRMITNTNTNTNTNTTKAKAICLSCENSQQMITKLKSKCHKLKYELASLHDNYAGLLLTSNQLNDPLGLSSSTTTTTLSISNSNSNSNSNMNDIVKVNENLTKEIENLKSLLYQRDEEMKQLKESNELHQRRLEEMKDMMKQQQLQYEETIHLKNQENVTTQEALSNAMILAKKQYEEDVTQSKQRQDMMSKKHCEEVEFQRNQHLGEMETLKRLLDSQKSKSESLVETLQLQSNQLKMTNEHLNQSIDEMNQRLVASTEDLQLMTASHDEALNTLQIRYESDIKLLTNSLEQAIASSIRLCVVAPTVNIRTHSPSSEQQLEVQLQSEPSQQDLIQFLRQVVQPYTMIFIQAKEGLGPEGDVRLDLQDWIEGMIQRLTSVVQQHIERAVNVHK